MTDRDGTRFEEAAQEFCADLEAGRADVRTVLRRLVGLLALVLDLPAVEPTEQEYDDPDDLDASCRAVGTNVARLVGDHDLYWEVFDPREEAAPVAGSLIDDLSDIYRDLRRGLFIAQVGARADAIWEWRFTFESHWGNHATDAVRVLHRVVTD